MARVCITDTGGLDFAPGIAALRAPGRPRGHHRRRGGQTALAGPRRGRLHRRHLPLLRRQRRADHEGRGDPATAGRGVGRRATLVAGGAARRHALDFPYYQVARFAAPNLLVGNTILLKHSEQCPESAAATAGRHLNKVVLELGGSDPFILLSTDDMDATVEAAVLARVDNAGQTCNAAKRFIVVADLYDAFLARFTEQMAAVPQGDPTQESTALGPLSSERAADVLQEQVGRAVAQGATLHSGGTRDLSYFSPTILTDVPSDADAFHEEFFGPVAQVFKVADEQEAIALANDTPFGLGSYVFTADPAQALRVADQLQAGMVFVNIVAADSAELPFGGVKRSGSGRELGRYGAEEFVNRKLIRIA